MGGGQQNFYPSGASLPSQRSQNGNRKDGRYLTTQWEQTQKTKGRKAIYIDSPKAFNDVNFEDYDYVLSKFSPHLCFFEQVCFYCSNGYVFLNCVWNVGLTSPSHLPYELDKPKDDPSLYNLTMAALKVLKKSPNGFFLFVEGARIDQAHHENRAMYAS